MAAVWLKLVTVLCLACTARSVSGKSGVAWRDYGGAVTIQCRPPKDQSQEYLTLKKGFNEGNDVFYKDGRSEKHVIAEEFTGRLQINGAFPNMDILIKNLTTEDTGPYRCIYKKFDLTASQAIDKEGTGSVLLVVTDTACDRIVQDSESNNNMILVTVVSCAAVLLGLIMCFLISILLKTKTSRTTQKPRRVTTDDVYEDMRGTIRH